MAKFQMWSLISIGRLGNKVNSVSVTEEDEVLHIENNEVEER
jgi:hypothetical protein